MVSIIPERYEAVINRIKRSAQAVNRLPSDIRLVVVTKGQPLERIRAVLW